MSEDVSRDDGEQLFQQRFGELIDLVGGPTKAGRITSVARQTVDQWRKEGRRIPLTAADDLARAAGKSLDWLMGRPGTADRVSSPLMRLDGPDSPLPEGFVKVPMLRITASAGPGRFTNSDDARGGDVVAFPEEWLRTVGLSPGRTDALTALGDSMEPTIRDGDMLLVDRSIDRVVDNGIYVVVFGGAVLVKRVHIRRDRSVVLRSENAVYPEEVVPADEVPDLVIEGRVRWFGRTI